MKLGISLDEKDRVVCVLVPHDWTVQVIATDSGQVLDTETCNQCVLVVPRRVAPAPVLL